MTHRCFGFPFRVFFWRKNLRNQNLAHDRPRCMEFLIVELSLNGERKGTRPPRSERLLLVTGRNININDILPGWAVMCANFVSAPLIYEWNASLCAVIWKVNSLSADLIRTEAADNCETGMWFQGIDVFFCVLTYGFLFPLGSLKVLIGSI